LQNILDKNFEPFDLGFFKVMYKFVVASALAITHQTQSRIAVMKGEESNSEVDLVY
jgi:hypothetical protein